MQIQKFGLFIALFCAAEISPGDDDLLGCLDDDVRYGLLGHAGYGENRYSSALPDRFESLTVPEEFELIGGSTSEHQIGVAYKSSSQPQQALSELEQVLSDQGWAKIESYQSRGFTATAIPAFTRFCRDGVAVMILSRQVDDLTYVNVTAPTVSGEACDADRSASRGLARTAMYNELPNLTLPERWAGQTGVSLRPSGSGSSGSGMGSSVHTTASLVADTIPAELLEAFGQQIRSQGWAHDASWTGNYSSGSTWSKLLDRDVRLVGMFEARGSGEKQWDLGFRMSVPGATASNLVGISTN